MHEEVARNNYQTLKTLPNNTKLRVDDSVKLVPEDRWFTTGRRYWEQTSSQVLKVILETFTVIHELNTEDDVLEVFNDVSLKLTKLYPNNTTVNETLNTIRAKLEEPIDVPVNGATSDDLHTNNDIKDQPNVETAVEQSADNVEPITISTLDEVVYVAPLRQRHIHKSRYEVVSGDVVLEMGDTDDDENADECCLIKWMRDFFTNINEKQK
jgi:hypothetical protein